MVTNKGIITTLYEVVGKQTRGALAWRLLFLVAFGLAAYANSFHATFGLDDLSAIHGNQAVKNLAGFTLSEFVRGWRPVGDFTFALNYRVNGLDVTGYHIVNLLVHLGNAALVYALVVTTLRTPWGVAAAHLPEEAAAVSRTGREIAFFAALLFVVHPVQTQAVTYIVQRFTSLATLFYLGSLLLYARARLVQEGGGAGRRRVLAAGLYLLALLAALLAMKTKQIAFTLPFVVVLYEFTFFSGRIVKRVGAMALFLLTLAVVPLTLTGPARLSGEFLDRLTALPKESPLMPRLDYLCTQFRVIVTYIRLLLFPAGQRLEYDYPIYRTFFTPPVLLSFLGLLALVVLGGFLWLRSRGVVRRAPVTGCSQRLVAFGIFWFFITLSVESSIIPISDVIFEHRLYLPSVGAAIAITAALLALVDRAAARRPWVRAGAAAGFVLVAALLALATFQRNRVWATEVSLWEDTVAKSPNLPRPLNNLAAVYLKNGDPHKALAVLVRANDLAPGYTDTWLNICIALDRLGMYDGRFRYGSELFDASGNIKPQHLTEWFALASNNLGLAHEVLGDHARALVQFDRALKLAPNLAEAHLNRGLALLASGDRGGALEEYRVLTTLDPKTARKMALWFAAGGGR